MVSNYFRFVVPSSCWVDSVPPYRSLSGAGAAAVAWRAPTESRAPRVLAQVSSRTQFWTTQEQTCLIGLTRARMMCVWQRPGGTDALVRCSLLPRLCAGQDACG